MATLKVRPPVPPPSLPDVQLPSGERFTAAQLTAAAMRNGLLTVPAGEKVLRLVPPLIVSAEQADRTVGILDASMAELMTGQQE